MVIFLGLALFLRQACISSFKLVEFRTCICGMSSRKANLFQRSTEKGEGKSCLCVSYHRFGMIWGSQDACQLRCHVSTVIKNIIWSTTFCQLPTSSQQCCNMTSLVSGRFRWPRWPSNSLHGPSSKLKHLKPSSSHHHRRFPASTAIPPQAPWKSPAGRTYRYCKLLGLSLQGAKGD